MSLVRVYSASVLVLSGLTLALSASVASAQDTDAPDPRVAEARHIFDDAERDFAAGRYLPAARGYQRAYELLREAGRETAPLVLYNVGRAYDRGDRPEEAVEAYRQFLSEAPAGNPEAERWRATARTRLSILDPDVEVDDPPPPPPQTETPEGGSVSGGTTISPVGPIVLGVGGALVVTGLVLGGVALAENGSISDTCPTRESCGVDERAAYDSARTLSLTGDILWIAGAVVAATGLVLTFVLTEEEGAPTASLGCGPSGCMAGLRGSF